MELLAFIVAVIFFIVLEAFFSGSEIALVSVKKAFLNKLAKKDKIIADFLKNEEDYITLTLFGYTLSLVFATIFYTYFWLKITEIYLPQLKGYEPLLAESLLIFTLIFGEILPKSLFLKNAEFLSPLLIKILYPLVKTLKPFLWLVKTLSQKISQIFGKERKFLTREELISYLIEGRVDISKTKRVLIANILSFRDRLISEIVKPIHEVVMVSESATVEQVAKKIKESGYSRLPVYATTFQNIIGYVEAYELIKAKKDEPVIKYLHPIKIVGEFQKLKNVLKEFISEKEHIAVVVDERGVVIGIITLEDIVEEITGEFYETNKKEEEEIKQLAPDKWLVNPNIEVSELNRLYNFKLPEGIYSTVGGLVQYYLGKIPKKGDKVEFPNLTIKVISADEKKIKKLLIIRKNTNSSK